MRRIAFVALLLDSAIGCQGAPLNAGDNLPNDIGVAGGLCVPGSMAACYTGPPGTDRVGLCARGTATCNADGKSFGRCQGDTTPQPDDCATPVDEDCDGLAPPCKGTLLWSKGFGAGLGFGDHIPLWGIAVDGTNNVLVTGRFVGAVDFGGGLLTSAGGYDVFIVKLDAAGNHLWSKSFGDASDQAGEAVGVDSSGNVVLAGWFRGSVDFGGGSLDAGRAVNRFIVKLDAAGNQLWTKRFDGSNSSYLTETHVAVDGPGNIVVTGNFSGSIDCGGGVLTSVGDLDLFVARLDAAGNHLWSRRFGDALHQRHIHGALDATGDILLAGAFSGSLNFGGGELTSAGGSDTFVAKIDTAGNHLWSKRFGGASDEESSAIAVDEAGDVFVTGSLIEAVDFGGGPLGGAGSRDVFLTKLSAAGQHVWSKRFGDMGEQHGYSVTADAAGNILLTGYLNGAIDFGGGPLASVGPGDAFGGGDVFLAKFDANGEPLWSKRFGDAMSQTGYSVAVDRADNALVLGEFRGAIDFGGSALVNVSGSDNNNLFDIFIAKFSP